MKIIVIGASGTIGRAVSEELSQRHEVIRVGRTREIIRWISPQESVEALFAQTGEVDAIVSTTGNLHFGPLSTMTDSQFNLGLQDKLLSNSAWRWSASIFCATAGRLPWSAVSSRRNPLLRGSMPRRSTPVWKALSAPPPASCRADPHQSHQPHRAQRVAGSLRRLFPGLPQRSRRRRGAGLRRSIEGVQTGRIYPVGY